MPLSVLLEDGLVVMLPPLVRNTSKMHDIRRVEGSQVPPATKRTFLSTLPLRPE